MSAALCMFRSKIHKGSTETDWTPDAVHALRDRYFFYSKEMRLPTIAIADEDTIIYLKERHGRQDGMLIVGNKREKRMVSAHYIKKDGSQVPIDVDQNKREILDLSGFGDRWEGSILDNMPFGWGLRYDRNGELVYEGFSLFGKASLYGTEYDPVTHNIIYQGTFCDDCRCGRGVQYDRNGNAVYDGEWLNDTHRIDKTVTVPESAKFLPPISSLLVSLHILKNACTENQSLILHHLPRLELLLIEEHCFGKKSEDELVFSCVDCPKLRIIDLSGSSVMQFFNRMVVTGGIEEPE